jgi:hypothetical protein
MEGPVAGNDIMEGSIMDARKVAAQFAAYVWYEEVKKGEASQKDISRFSRQNWKAFLPLAPEGLGRLLIRVTSHRHGGKRRLKRERLRAAVA